MASESSTYEIEPIRRLPSYRTTAGKLGSGPSLGNSALWVTTKYTGDIERVFSIPQGKTVVGSIAIRFSIAGRPLHDATLRFEGSTTVYAPLALAHDEVVVEIHPAYLRRRFDVGGSIYVTETIFLPFAAIGDANEPDPPILYQQILIENRGAQELDLRVNGFARLRGDLPEGVVAAYDSALRALVARNEKGDGPIRVFGLTRTPSAHETNFDYANVYSITRTNPLSNNTDVSGDLLGMLQLDLTIPAGGRELFAFKTGIYGRDHDDAALAAYAGANGADALEGTLDVLDDELHRGEVVTPDDVINDGVLWSKVNMRRVMARYPTGWLFTNDPGVTSNVVIRDCAWFVYGCDYFAPVFSRSLLDTAARLQYSSGKLPEFVDALSGRVEDDGLNINDDTPLFIMAANHHFRITGDLEWLRDIYPALARAGRYIISQMDERALVVCTADDPRGNVWAIASWRNIIPNYSINGTVTEINAECAAALRELAHLAEQVAEDPSGIEAFSSASQRIAAAMQMHLINPKNGLFYLNIDVQGNPHTDVTGDEIFPVMFRVCDEEVGFRIISRLNSPDFWTDAGLRTASMLDPRYDPKAFSGLLGGVWPGLTWWYAFAAARYHPEFMVQALRASFEHYARDPRLYDTVPGQFGEWFNGDSLVNQGMRLSPWEPPRFLWAAIEGVCGLTLAGDRAEINPLIPANWKWVGLRRLPYRGNEISYFAVRAKGSLMLFTTCEVNTTFAHSLYDRDVSDKIAMFSRVVRMVALQRDGEIALLVGNASHATTSVPIDLSDVLEPRVRYRTRVYNSERDDWETDVELAREEICVTSIGIESKGYRVMLFRPVTEREAGTAHGAVEPQA